MEPMELDDSRTNSSNESPRSNLILSDNPLSSNVENEYGPTATTPKYRGGLVNRKQRSFDDKEN